MILLPTLSPTSNILRTSYATMQSPKHVTINLPTLQTLSQTLHSQIKQKPVNWDESNWHYVSDGSKEDDEVMALYVFTLDCMNFCFWPSRLSLNADNKDEVELQYDHLALALKNIAKQLTAGLLSTITPEELEGLIGKFLPCKLPAIEERCRLLNELGHVLLTGYNGSALEMIKSCNSSADKLVKTITDNLPGFRDTCVNGTGEMLFFYKRAQIVCGDLWAAFNSRSPCDFHDIPKLTTFADYRVPQLLRELDVMAYSSELSSIVDGSVEILAGSVYEIEIRAATIVAVDMLVNEYNKLCENGGEEERICAVKVDWYLWQIGEEREGRGEMKPHHLVRTIFY